MAKPKPDIPKRRGRPKTTGRGKGVLIRLHRPQIAPLDKWIAAQPDQPSRPEAIRRLVERALAREAAKRPLSKKTVRKASQLAAREIDTIADKSLPVVERQQRKRRLIRGPSEFRDIRSDLPKSKS
jgi:hypothetical protein